MPRTIVVKCDDDGTQWLGGRNVVCESNTTIDISGILWQPSIVELSGNRCEIDDAGRTIACAAVEVGGFDQFTAKVD